MTIIKRCPRCGRMTHRWRKWFGAVGFCTSCMASIWKAVTLYPYRHIS